MKRGRLVQSFLSHKWDIILLQETHVCDTNDIKIWSKLWPGKSFFSFGSNHSYGVGILFSAHLGVINFDAVQRDNDGRRVIVDFTLNCGHYRLINVYRPNHAPTRKAFIASLATWVVTSCRLIVGGDFSFIENPSLDKQGGNITQGMLGKMNDTTLVKLVT